MLRAPKNAKKLSENDMHINRLVREDFMGFTNDISLLMTPSCVKYHEDAARSISERIESVRKHLEECRALTADSEVIAEAMSKHIAYVEDLLAKASGLIHEEAEASAESAEKQEESVSSEEGVALRFGRLWEKGGHRRVYLDEKAVAKAVGFELRSVRGTKRYCLGEEEYANATMSKLFKAFDGTYYDLLKRGFVSPSSKNSLLDDFRAVFSSEVEAAKSSSAESEPGHDGEPMKEEVTSTEERYDPERHMRAAEVKAIFKTLLPHAPNSMRLCIWDITPGLSSGEVYRIGLSYTEEEMGLLSRYSHPASTMAISRRVTSDSLWGGWAPMYEVIFDRDVVEELVKTWKASDSVCDRRAEEAARKERAKARREAQAIRETQDVK